MSMSDYVRRLRVAVGHDLLVLPAVTGIIFDENSNILLVRQRDLDLWSTPGGAIEPDESPADAVSREVWEETGLLVSPIRVMGVRGGKEYCVIYPNGDRVSYITTIFECAITGGTIQPSPEVSAAAFVGAHNVGSYRLTPWAQRILPELFGRPPQATFDGPTWQLPSIAPSHR